MTTRATQETRADAADADTMPKRRRFDVWERHAMAEAGILHPEERLESIDGDIMVLNPFESAFTAVSEDRPDMGWVRMDIDSNARIPFRILSESGGCLRLFSVEEYYAMGDAGILGDDERVELIDGEILVMAPPGPLHAYRVMETTELLVIGVRGRAHVSVQNLVLLGGYAAPQPDFAVVKRREGFYRTALPSAEDALLIVEISHTTLCYDRGRKLALYARNSIPEVWIANIRQRMLEAHSEPVGGVYTQSRRYS